jgi:hypothetical protein
MNKIYDKLLLAFAALALLAGVGFYVAKSGAIPSAQSSGGLQSADNPYQAIPLMDSSSESTSWPDPELQSTGWTYDVFTPPKIFIGENGEFMAEGWVPPPPPAPFGVYLVEVKRDLYRLQIEGYIEEDRTDDSKSLVLLFDKEKQSSVRARVGQEQAESEFKLLDFSIERIRKSESEIYKEVKATILDTRSGEEVVLTEGEKLYDAGITVVLASHEDATFHLELKEAGQTFKTATGEYILKEINLEGNSVTVEKLADEERESEMQSLSPQAPIKQQAEPESTKTEAAEQSFDFNF